MNGLFICEKLPFLAASPDGIVKCDCCEPRVLEIKCPYCLSSVGKIIEDVPYIKDGHLNQNHAYYYQVQTQMICTKMKYADFFCLVSSS
jgi:hypothetical protein